MKKILAYSLRLYDILIQIQENNVLIQGLKCIPNLGTILYSHMEMRGLFMKIKRISKPT